METEEVILLKVVKQGGSIMVDVTRDTTFYEVLGILIPYVEHLKESLMLGFEAEEYKD